MSLDVLTTEKWLIDQLRRLIGFDEVEEIAAYIMTFPIDDEAGLASYLGELFGSSSDVELLAKGLCSRRKAASEESAEDSNSSSAARVGKSKKKKATPVASYASSPLFASATPPPSADTQTVPAKKLSQKERARLNRLNTIAGGNGGGGGRAEGVEPPAPPSSEAAPAAAEGSGAASSRSMGSGSGVGAGRGIGSGGGVSQQGNNGSGSVRSAPNNEEGGGVEEEEEEEEELDEDGFQRFDVGQLTEAGGVSSSAAGGGRQLTHALTPGGSGALVNCLKCGFINVLPAALVNGSSGKAAKGGTKEMGGKGASASPSGSWGGCSGCGLELERCTDTDPSFALGFTAALALKDRLVRYDHENIEVGGCRCLLAGIKHDQEETTKTFFVVAVLCDKDTNDHDLTPRILFFSFFFFFFLYLRVSLILCPEACGVRRRVGLLCLQRVAFGTRNGRAPKTGRREARVTSLAAEGYGGHHRFRGAKSGGRGGRRRVRRRPQQV